MADDNEKISIEEYKLIKKAIKRDKNKQKEENWLAELEEELDNEELNLDPKLLNKLRKR